MEDEWITVGAKKVTPVVPKNWCMYGNTCVWRNCPYLHVRCEHHDRWLASGKKTRPCRNSFDCKYDHRDNAMLKTYVHTLPVNTEQELMDSFFSRGLDMRSPGIFDKSNMHVFDRALLYRSLTTAGLSYEKLDDSICITFEHTDGEAGYNSVVYYGDRVFDTRDYVAAWTEWNEEIRNEMAF